ncbi:MAG: M48 family metalloprotease [Gaiellaceae bacterium]
MNSLDFSHEDVERASRYHRPLYLSLAAATAVSLAVYSLLAWSWIGRRLFVAVGGFGWAGMAAAWAGVVLAVAELASLPLAFWRGHLRERRWGFSTQTAAGWVVDRLKGFALSLGLGAGAWVAAVGLARALPSLWPLAAAGALAFAVLVLASLTPVLLEPIFNRFEPLADERLAAELRALGDRAGVPVRDVLVADASRRTTKTNGYVSGVGRTRRVVLYDTLLAGSGENAIKLIVAHELGHCRERHVAKLTAIAMGGSVVAVLLLRAALGTPTPRNLPLALLVLAGLQAVALVPFAALSRRYERVADRWSLELTDDLSAFEQAHVSLAKTNLSDLDPPRLAYALLFTHPTPPERLALARARVTALHGAPRR